jgi:hypothetical protein
MILITATGGRPECTALIAEYMARQTYSGPRYWLVVDDCDPPTPVPGADRIIRPAWRWRQGENTYGQNLLLLLDEAKQLPFDKLLIIEDDEWYGPDYLAEMDRALDDCDLAGEFKPRYYCVRTRTYKTHGADGKLGHSCLCRTGLNRNTWPLLREVILDRDHDGPPFYDRVLWRWKPDRKLIVEKALSVGIKGMPGRAGIGGGHHGHFSYAPDPELKVLREWIGSDAERYASYYQRMSD